MAARLVAEPLPPFPRRDVRRVDAAAFGLHAHLVAAGVGSGTSAIWSFFGDATTRRSHRLWRCFHARIVTQRGHSPSLARRTSCSIVLSAGEAAGVSIAVLSIERICGFRRAGLLVDRRGRATFSFSQSYSWPTPCSTLIFCRRPVAVSSRTATPSRRPPRTISLNLNRYGSSDTSHSRRLFGSFHSSSHSKCLPNFLIIRSTKSA